MEVSWTRTKKLDFHLQVQVRSRRGKCCWALKRVQKRSRAGRWRWAQKVRLVFCFSCSSTAVLRTLSLSLCSARQLKRQLSEYACCCTMVRSRRDQEQGGGAGLRKLDSSFASVVPQQLCYGHCLSLCSARQLKRQLSEYACCCTMVRSPPP